MGAETRSGKTHRAHPMKILDQLVVACRTMHFAPATESCYRGWIADFLSYHRNRTGEWIHPERLREGGAPAIFGSFDHGRVHSDSALNVRNRTQLLAALARTEIPTVWG